MALIVPSESEADLCYEFLRLRDSWPKNPVEVKGSRLDESQSAEVIDLLCKYEVLVKFFAVDMATHGEAVVSDLKARQAAGVIANLTPEHNHGITAQLHGLATAIRGMPNQLFLQAFLMIELVLKVIEEGTLYFAQRLPRELGEIKWIVDRKNRTITQMEEMWTTLILPMSETHFGRTPLKTLVEADYSHFDARYGFSIETGDTEMLRHLEWVRQAHGGRPLTPTDRGIDAKLLLTDQRDFLDSQSSLGLQLADMLATILRRALNDRLQFRGWKNFGRLLAREGQPGSSFLQLGRADGAPRSLKGHAEKVCRALDATAKSMLLRD